MRYRRHRIDEGHHPIVIRKTEPPGDGLPLSLPFGQLSQEQRQLILFQGLVAHRGALCIATIGSSLPSRSDSRAFLSSPLSSRRCTNGAMSHPTTLGIDFGTDSVRLVIVDVATGRILEQATRPYTHGVLDRTLPNGIKLPPDAAYQHPLDWIHDASTACRTLMRRARTVRSSLVGIGVDFTSCTMLPCARWHAAVSGRPFARIAMAWPKLWKHHGRKEQSERITAVASAPQRWLARYGGSVGLEWFFPKVLETLEAAPQIYRAADAVYRSRRLVRLAADRRPPSPHSDPDAASSAPPARPATRPAGARRMATRRAPFPRRWTAAGKLRADKMPGVHSRPRDGGRAAERVGRPAARPAAGPSCLHRDHRCPCRRARRRCLAPRRDGDGHRHQHLPHDEPHQPAAPSPASPASSRMASCPATSATKAGQASVGDAYAWVVRAHRSVARAAHSRADDSRRDPAACSRPTSSMAAAPR